MRIAIVGCCMGSSISVTTMVFYTMGSGEIFGPLS
jgi:hypothetical protein